MKARARSGEIPAYMPGRKWVFLQDELLEYLKTTTPNRAKRNKKTSYFIPNLAEEQRRLDARLGPVTRKKLPSQT